MSEFVDFAALKERIDIRELIPILGLTMKQAGVQYRGPCPVCKGDPRALAINSEKNGFYCHARGKGGDSIALTAHVRGTSQREAALFLQDHLGAGEAPRSRASETAHNALQPLDYLETDHEVIELLGLSVAACEALGAGFAPKGVMTGRIVIPLRLPDGTLVGYFGIATKEDQVPLLKFPPNLEERCRTVPSKAEAPPKVPGDELRKLLRVV
jgi:hypothetical protein